jgi:FAD dependent oxidoreductase TIGR03364
VATTNLSGGPYDVAIVGAGIVGLAHAYEAVRRGLSAIVVERDERALGASVRNFGHGFMTAQAGEALDAALEARTRWSELSRAAGFWLGETGSVLVARADDELDVMREFAARSGPEAAILTRDEVLARVPVSADGVTGGLWAPLDFRVEPREAVSAIARWLADARGVTFAWGTTCLGAEPGRLRTSRGDVAAEHIVLAAGHDLDRLLPAVADEARLERCALQMLRVAAPNGHPIEPAVLTGLALLRYRGFAACPSLPTVRERVARERPDLLAAEVNLMLTQRPDGDLVVGDTHVYARTPPPFQDERLDDLLLDETAALLGADRLRVRERWRGVYAHAPGRDFLVAMPTSRVRAVAVTTGIGMTTALGLAPQVLDDLLSDPT